MSRDFQAEVSRTRLLSRSLSSTMCPACGGTKRSGQTLCGTCYRLVWPKERVKLYRRFGEGYEEAFDGAMQILRVEKPIWPDDDSTHGGGR